MIENAFVLCVRSHIDIYLVFELNKVLVGLGVGVVGSLWRLIHFSGALDGHVPK